MHESLPRCEDAAHGGQVLRDVLARCATARAYGAVRREVDFIDVAFEEIHDPASERSLPDAARPMRALTSGAREG